MLHPATSARRAAVVLGVMAVLFLVATPVAFNQSPPIAVSPPSKPSPTSWLVQPIERGPEFALPDVRCHINAIAFAPGSDTLVAAGDGGLLLASVDGGRTWRAPTVTWESSASDELGSPAAATEPGRPCRSRSDLLGIAWADDMNALVVGRGGTVLLTDDGGKRWSAAPRPAVADLHGAVFHLDGKRGWVVGDGGLLLETRDRGRTWQSVVRATDKDLHAVASGVVGRWLWASGAGVVVASSDGGDRWSAVPAPAATRFTGIALHPDSGAVLLTDEAGTVHTSTDDGATWQSRKLSARALRAVSVSPDGALIAVAGDGGTVALSEDGGMTWTSMSTGVSTSLRAAAIAAGSRALLAGEAGVVLGRAGDGAGWTPLTRRARSAAGAADVANADQAADLGEYARYPALWYFLLGAMIAIAVVVIRGRWPSLRERGLIELGASDRPIAADDPDPLGIATTAER